MKYIYMVAACVGSIVFASAAAALTARSILNHGQIDHRTLAVIILTLVGALACAYVVLGDE